MHLIFEQPKEAHHMMPWHIYVLPFGSRPEKISLGLVATFVLVFLPSALPGTPGVLSSASAASSLSSRYVSPCMGRYHPCAGGAACLAAQFNPLIQNDRSNR